LRPPRKVERCSRYALSFYVTVDAARSRLRGLGPRVDTDARYGGWIGEIHLDASDGVSCQPDGDGHFDLHQEDAVSFEDRVMAYHAP
jgi:hypothetical protein